MILAEALVDQRRFLVNVSRKEVSDAAFFRGVFEAAQLCGAISENKASIIQMFYNCGRLGEALSMLENVLTVTRIEAGG